MYAVSSANHAVLQEIGTCRDVENPDRRLSLGPRHSRQERPQPGGVELHMATDWTSLIVHGIRDERRVRVQPRNEGIIVCAFL